MLAFVFLYPVATYRHLHSFPTRRSSDLGIEDAELVHMLRERTGQDSPILEEIFDGVETRAPATPEQYAALLEARDRKSTRLNSSHVAISYAVFCLKTSKNAMTRQPLPTS